MGKTKLMMRLEDSERRSAVGRECACLKWSWGARFTKRTIDLLGAFLGLVLFSPVFLLIYLAVKMEDHGKVIFRQERVGYRGKAFTLYKFRSMIEKAEVQGRPQLCQEEDHRLTRVGRFLRMHHLDELPQLWNVLKGDMSLVGPRPERRFFVEQIVAINPDYELLYALRPGLFSEATLYNGYTDTMAKMLKRLNMDLHYLHNRSLWLDVKIIYFTVYSILSGKKF